MPLEDPYGNLIVLTTRDFRTKDPNLKPHLHEVFEKRRYLYGLSVAKQHIIKTQKAIIVEGQFDTTVLHTYWFEMTVGVLGSAFSFDHVCLLRRYCKEIYFMFDSDDAGDASRNRIMELYREKCLSSFDVSFIPVRLPAPSGSKVDPDDFIKANGRKALLEVLKQSKIESQLS